MKRLSASAVRAIAFAVVGAVVLGAGYFYFFAGPANKTVTAYFTSGVGVYPGTPVRILGIQVGQVTAVTPDGASVKIEMNYAAQYSVPHNASAVIVANSLVSDRYIQLTPVYPGTGPVMASGASIPLNQTSSPAELDDVYAALNKLSVSLGPNGANKNGALKTLVDVAAANLQGNGAALGNSIKALAAATTTLANGRGDLFATVAHLRDFTATLANSDVQVRHFENQLAQVAGDLANERTDLGAALHNLSLALDSVAGFVHDNAGRFHTDVVGLETLTGILVKEQAALNESLSVAPVALANLIHAYQPPPQSLGLLATRSNIGNLANPIQVCAALNSLGQLTGNKVPPSVISACKTVAGPGGLGSLPVIGGLTSTLPTLPGAS